MRELFINLLGSSLGDFMIALTQSSLFRWSMALFCSFWVWMVGDERTSFRGFYLIFPFIIAAILEVLDTFFLGAVSGKATIQGGWIPYLLLIDKSIGYFSTPIGMVSLVFSLILGLKRGLGFVLIGGLLLVVYFYDYSLQTEGKGISQGKEIFTWDGISQIIIQLPTILLPLLICYGIGATFRKIRELRYDY